MGRDASRRRSAHCMGVTRMEAKQGDRVRPIGAIPRALTNRAERAAWREAAKAWPHLRYEHRALLTDYCREELAADDLRKLSEAGDLEDVSLLEPPDG